MLILKVQNDGTGTNDSANYKYTVSVNRDIISFGEVKSHDRGKGWKELISKLIEVEKLNNEIP